MDEWDGGLIRKYPFKDHMGRWWIYRADDPDMYRPLGPFFFPNYAYEAERLARVAGAPFPRAFGPMPGRVVATWKPPNHITAYNTHEVQRDIA